MDAARPKNTNNLLSLNEAAKKLGVTPEMLLSLNEYNILKPVLTLKGEIGYTPEQIENFIRIRKLSLDSQSNLTPVTETHAAESSSNQQIDEVVLPEITARLETITHKEEKAVPMKVATQTHGTKMFSLPYFFAVSVSSFVIFFMLFTFISALINGKNEARQQAITDKSVSAITTHHSAPKTLHAQTQSERLGKEEVSALADNTTLGQSDMKKPVAASPSKTISQLQKDLNQSAVANQEEFFASKGSCPGCVEEEKSKESVFDEQGNIKGQDQNNLLAVGGLKVPEVDESSLDSERTTSPMLLVTVAVGGFLGLLFVFRNQFAGTPAVSSISDTQAFASTGFVPDKVLEISQKTDGSIMLYFEGNEYKVSKPELDSESDQFISRLMELTSEDTKEIEYDALDDDQISLNAPLSKLVTRLGFVGIKRDLFFPRTSKTKVLFRKYVTEDDLLAMSLPKEQIGTHL